MRKAVYHPKVPSEVTGIIRYYEQISGKLADNFWLELTAAIEYAKTYPELRHFDPSGRRRSNLSRFPYHFLFRVSELSIRITAARHNKRNPDLGSRRR